MSGLRTLTITVGILLVFALVASACSSTDDGESAGSQPAAAEQLISSGFQIESTKFQEKTRPRTRIPKENTCLGDNLSPPLDWKDAPPGVKSYALIAEDVDDRTGIWVHWVLYNIPADVSRLPEGITTSTNVLPDGTTQGTNDYKTIGYNGPCPPPALLGYWEVGVEPPHKYFFRLYALDTELGLAPGATKAELVSAIEGHVLAQADTVGKFMAPPQVKETLTQVASSASRKTPIPGQPSPTPIP